MPMVKLREILSCRAAAVKTGLGGLLVLLLLGASTATMAQTAARSDRDDTRAVPADSASVRAKGGSAASASAGS